MSTSPLYYQPLVMGRIAATSLGEATLHDVRDQQLNFEITANEAGQLEAQPQTTAAEKFDKSEGAPVLGGFFYGITQLQNQLPGSAPIKRFQLATSSAGEIANRVDTSLRNHAEALLTLSPDKAAEFGASLVQAAAKEIEQSPVMRSAGDVLDIGADTSRMLIEHTQAKEPMAADQAAFLAVMTGRELQRSVTPVPVDTESELSWIDNATADLIATWPGAISHAARTLGLSDDSEALDKLGQQWKNDAATNGPNAEAVRGVIALLRTAGVDLDAPEAVGHAFDLLQKQPLEAVPNALAAAMLEHNELPEAMAGYFASRIAETRGTDGNISGLIAELDSMKQPPPAEEPPVDEPPSEDPSSEEPVPDRGLDHDHDHAH